MLVLVKELKNIKEYWDEENKEFIFQRGNIQFALTKGEFFPTQRAFTRVEQRGFYKHGKNKRLSNT